MVDGTAVLGQIVTGVGEASFPVQARRETTTSGPLFTSLEIRLLE